MRLSPVLVLALLFNLCSGVVSGAAESARVNPHSVQGACDICHTASEEKLNSWFSSKATKRELKADVNKVCQQCHTVQISSPDGFLAIGSGHATGKKTPMNLRNLPLSADGTINCALTCHDVHSTSNDRQQQRMLLRLPLNDLCTSCHR